MSAPIREYIDSDDPLNEEVFKCLLEHRQEDIYVDYKVEFHYEQDREWLELTKDLIAFANWLGGYLVFGIKNATFEPKGIDDETIKILCNTDELMKKANRFVEPQFKFLRSKEFAFEGNKFVVIHIPESKGITHIIAKNGAFKQQSGEEKIILHAGTFYLRRCGGNELATARGFDEIINKRIDHFKDSLFSKISRVIKAPAESEVFLLRQDPSGEVHKKFIIQDGPDAIPIKGMSFTVPPSNPEEEICAHIALLSKNIDETPPDSMIWRWYKERTALNLSSEQKLMVARFSILLDAPVFYWIKNCESSQIADMLCNLLDSNRDYFIAAYTVDVTGFLYRTDSIRVLRKLGKMNFETRKMARRNQKNNPRNAFTPGIVESRRSKEYRNRDNDFRIMIEKELAEIASSACSSSNKRPGMQSRYDAKAFDCFLYARDDKYQ